ncbi:MULTISPECIES: ribosome biogenesis GTPase Der [Collinsella]|jgi:GTPase|uniref:GTPase Der n=2 Tax=Collinsella tanakaei TaxID=626935 RepID=G1WFX1_9ACTN|nr:MULTISPECIES: ribosome biogenesis GTPase Der [Collinsella]EGX67913.1 ribosome-associated GTPase EngA [Collinsella tanakaei YIT 12063]RGL07123.1 ribosome biogenesis GTPase Der [Collinsella tanakaei]
MKPIVAIVGRPNVGKSTLVNRIAQTADAIVHQSRGVTRDRSYHEADWNGRSFTLVDTGGIEPLKSEDVFSASIRDQALAACEEAAVILFVVDGTTGVTEEDESVARMLKRVKAPVFLLVNKLDNPDREGDNLWEFYSLGVGEPIAISALHGHGTGDLLDEVVALFPEEDDLTAEPSDPNSLSVAIIGRPNAGKSSLFNKIIGSDRSIVSDIAGTTRDAIDTIVERDGRRYCMVDTAGIRKKSTVYENIEYYSMVRGLRAIDRADVALLVVDSTTGMTEQDQKVANLAIERGCALVILLNKWDLLKDDREREQVMETVDRRLTLAPWASVLRISALTGRSVEKIWALIDAAAAARASKVSTSRLNQMLTEMREFGHTVVDGKRRLRMHYVTQTGTKPPTFTFFVNHTDMVNDTYRRYIENRMRAAFDFKGTPIRLRFRKKDSKKED